MKTNNRNRYEHPEMTLVEVSPYGRLLAGSTLTDLDVTFGEEDLTREFEVDLASELDDYDYHVEDWL